MKQMAANDGDEVANQKKKKKEAVGREQEAGINEVLLFPNKENE